MAAQRDCDIPEAMVKPSQSHDSEWYLLKSELWWFEKWKILDIYSNIFWTLHHGGFPAVRWTFAEMKLRRGPWEAWNLHDFRHASSSPGDVAQLLPQGTQYPTTFVTSKIQFFIHFEGGHVTEVCTKALR